MHRVAVGPRLAKARRVFVRGLGLVATLTGLLACSSSPSPDAGEGGTDAGTDHGEAGTVSCASFDASGPFLTDLRVESAGDGGSIRLTPPFCPSIHDYYVSCSSGTNKLTVSMTAASGSESALVQPSPSSAMSSQTITVSVAENDAIVAAAKRSTSETDYWVRCLPSDFPQVQVTAYPDAGSPTPGYYLVGSTNPIPDLAGLYAIVFDQNGVPVWYYNPTNGLPIVDVDSIVPSSISFSFEGRTKTTPDPAEPFTVIDPGDSSAATTTFGPDAASGFTTDFHELQATANGYVVISFPTKENVDLTGLTIAGADGGTPLGTNESIQDCAVVEFDKSGNLLWSWMASEHFDPKDDTIYIDSTNKLGPYGGGVGEVYDVFHCNSIDVDPANGNYLVSARQMDSVFYIEKATKKVLWKMGGSPVSLDNATYVSVASPFHRQHDGRLVAGWQPGCNGGSGRVSVFDDESPGSPTTDGGSAVARGVVYDVTVGQGAGSEDGGSDGGGTLDAGGCTITGDAGVAAPGTATLAFEYKALSNSILGGNVRFLADGSRVVAWGVNLAGLVYPILSEFDDQGHDLLDLNFVSPTFSYRGIKVPLSAFDLDTLRKNAGQALP